MPTSAVNVEETPTPLRRLTVGSLGPPILRAGSVFSGARNTSILFSYMVLSTTIRITSRMRTASLFPAAPSPFAVSQFSAPARVASSRQRALANKLAHAAIVSLRSDSQMSHA
jgi:hypothetical protein